MILSEALGAQFLDRCHVDVRTESFRVRESVGSKIQNTSRRAAFLKSNAKMPRELVQIQACAVTDTGSPQEGNVRRSREWRIPVGHHSRGSTLPRPQPEARGALASRHHPANRTTIAEPQERRNDISTTQCRAHRQLLCR
jgi:hypothetical protein